MISIIIIVKNDRRIRSLMSSLALVEKPERTEIIVVDASNGSLDDIRRCFPEATWVTYVADRSKTTMIPQQRNEGIKRSRGDIIVFIDSDCTPCNDWLVELVKPIREEGEEMVAGYVQCSDYMSLRMPRSRYVDFWGNANLAFTRGLANRVGLYDESMERAEDYDYCSRARLSGYKIRFSGKAVVSHSSEGFKKNVEKAFANGIAAARFYKSHRREIRLTPHFAVTVAYPLYILLLPLCLIWSYYPLLILVPTIVDYGFFKRSPAKEIVNLSYGLGVLKELLLPKRRRGQASCVANDRRLQ
jgi:GT2 family glycosyltransferase